MAEQDKAVAEAAGRRATEKPSLRHLIAVAALFCGGAIGRNLLVAYGPPWWQPAVRCDRPQLDLGTVPADRDVPFAFVLANAGGRPLTIHQVTAECGCTAMAQDLAGRQVPPGGEVAVQGRLHVGGVAETITKSLWVRTDDPRRPLVRLTITAAVRP
jgi:hypothetical protein